LAGEEKAGRHVRTSPDAASERECASDVPARLGDAGDHSPR
jgi:hypothetical protein